MTTPSELDTENTALPLQKLRLDASIDRRRFVSRVALAIGGVGVFAERSSASIRQALATTQDEESLRRWLTQLRSEIPAATRSRYFQTAGIGPSPREVIAEISDALEFQNQSPADPEIALAMADIEPRLRGHLASSLGADTDEVALTHSTSEGINIVSWSIAWQPDDEVIISNQEHPSNIIPWYNLRERFGIVLKEIDLQSGTDTLDQVERALTDRCRLVSLSHVSRNNGRLIPDEESSQLAQRLRDRGVRYHLDGAQGPACVPVGFHRLGCDYYSTCGHKWLLGPKGTGALLVRRAILDDTLVSWTGAHSHDTMDYEGNFTLKPDASRFEFGTRALATFAGFEQALRYWDRVGWQRVFETNARLVDYAIGRIDESARLNLSSPRPSKHRSSIVSLRLPDGVDATELYHRLREDDGILASPVRDPRDFRLAIHCFNTEEDIDRAVEAIERRSL